MEIDRNKLFYPFEKVLGPLTIIFDGKSIFKKNFLKKIIFSVILSGKVRILRFFKVFCFQLFIYSPNNKFLTVPHIFDTFVEKWKSLMNISWTNFTILSKCNESWTLQCVHVYRLHFDEAGIQNFYLFFKKLIWQFCSSMSKW